MTHCISPRLLYGCFVLFLSGLACSVLAAILTSSSLLIVVGLSVSILPIIALISLLGLHHKQILRALPEITLLVLCFLFIVIVNVFGCKISSSFDSRWSVHTAMSMLKDGDTDLNEFQNLIEEDAYYGIYRLGDRLYSMYPIGTSFLTLPYLTVLDRFYKRTLGIELQDFISTTSPRGIEIFIASNIVALTAIFIYLIGRLYFSKWRYAFLLACIFVFCTSAWSTASRALWQHGPSAMMLALSLYLLLLVQRFPRYEAVFISLLSVVLAFSFVIRPTNALSILVMTLFVLVRHPRYFPSYCLWSLFVVIPFLTYNFSVYHNWLPLYYTAPNQLGLNGAMLEGLAGTLISPSRGLFVFTPILLFSILGVILQLRQHRLRLHDLAILSIILLHWGISSAHPHWWGGHSYGPRYFTDVLPYCVYFLIPVLRSFSTPQTGSKRLLMVGFSCMLLLSFLIHARGATSWDVYYWNSSPVNVDEQPARVWDWRDIQFLRGLGQ